MRASISSVLAFSASSIAFLASGFLTANGFTESTFVIPAILACSTSAFVVALSIASFSASAFALASAFAFAFSSAVKSSFASIASSFAFNAASIAFLAAGFLAASGLNEFTSLKPDILFTSTLISVSASSIACLAASAFFLASSLAFSFCSGVKLGSLSMFLIFSSKSLSTDSFALAFSSGEGVVG